MAERSRASLHVWYKTYHDKLDCRSVYSPKNPEKKRYTLCGMVVERVDLKALKITTICLK